MTTNDPLGSSHAVRRPRRPERAPASGDLARRAVLVALGLGVVLLVKGIVRLQLHEHPLLQPHGELDTASYVDLARRIAAGGPGALKEPLFVSPLYVYVLALIFAAGGSLLAVKLVQIILGTAAVALLVVTTREWFGPRAAWVAGGLATATGLFTFYEVLILRAALDPFLVACTLFTVSRALLDGLARWTLASGVAAGLLGLNRPNALLYGALLPLLFAAHAWRRDIASARAAEAPARRAGPTHRSGPARAAFIRGFLCATGLLAVLLSNGLLNYAISGEFLFVASHGGLNFYIGNHEAATGVYVPVPGISASIAGQARDARRVAEAATGRRLSAGDVSAYFYRQALAWMGAHPLDAGRLFGRKLAILVNATNVPLNYSYAYYSRDEPTLLRWLIIGPGFLVPLGLVGLCWRRLRVRQTGFWVWAVFVPVYGISVAAFFVSSRYRMPLLVPLCASAALLVGAVDQLRARRIRPLAAPLVAAGVLAALAHWDLRLDDGRGGEQTRMALWLIEEGRYGEAEGYVRQVAARHPQPGVLHFQVGRGLSAAGRVEAALPHLQAALAIDGPRPAIRLELGQALVLTGRSGEAVDYLRAALAADFRPELAAPWLARALVLSGRRGEAARLLADLPERVGAARVATAVDLGEVALNLGEVRQAERWLRLAVAGAPDDAGAHEKLATALLLQGRPEEAIPLLERACRLDPTNATAQLNLAVAYAAVGRLADARARALEAVRLDPAEPRATSLLETLRRGGAR